MKETSVKQGHQKSPFWVKGKLIWWHLPCTGSPGKELDKNQLRLVAGFQFVHNCMQKLSVERSSGGWCMWRIIWGSYPTLTTTLYVQIIWFLPCSYGAMWDCLQHLIQLVLVTLHLREKHRLRRITLSMTVSHKIVHVYTILNIHIRLQTWVSCWSLAIWVIYNIINRAFK